MISPTTISAKVPAACRRREHAGRDRDDGEAVEDQRGGVIGEPFAFEHDQKAARQAEPPRDRERRDHVRRRHDRAEHESDAPRPAEQIVQRGRDRDGREHHRAEGEQRDRPQIEAEFAPAHRHAGRIDQRRQQHQQHQIRRKFDRRQAGNERKRDAGDHQQDRRRRASAAAQRSRPAPAPPAGTGSSGWSRSFLDAGPPRC